MYQRVKNVTQIRLSISLRIFDYSVYSKEVKRMRRYSTCIWCGSRLYENTIVVRRKGYTGSYCSYMCAAFQSDLFNTIELTDKVVQDDKECSNSKGWELEEK